MTDKKIEEMAKVISKIDFAVPYQEKEKHLGGLYGYIAEELINAGYGNVKQAVKEFADMVVDTLDNYQYDDMTVREIVDNLMTELYGGKTNE